jgi:hypothetical protein
MGASWSASGKRTGTEAPEACFTVSQELASVLRPHLCAMVTLANLEEDLDAGLFDGSHELSPVLHVRFTQHGTL